MRRPTLKRERALWAKGFQWVAGLDEVGRGPLAGPVVAAAVILPSGERRIGIKGLRDSKLMTAAQREVAAVRIRKRAVAWSVAAASVREIDRFNIRRASALAMRRALERLSCTPDYVLIDGTPLPELGTEHEAMVGGDRRCASIAAASVLAKCVRDRLMIQLAQRYPVFRWEANKGYATRDHLDVLDLEGPTPHHRRSFTPVVQLRML